MGKQLPVIFSESGGSSLYFHNNITIEEKHGRLYLSTKINRLVTIEVFYDKFATSQFSMEQILGDFWGQVSRIADENGYHMKGYLLP